MSHFIIQSDQIESDLGKVRTVFEQFDNMGFLHTCITGCITRGIFVVEMMRE